MKKKHHGKLVFRVAPTNGGVVFATPDRATHIAQINSAIRSAKTWGQFKRLMPPEEYESIMQGLAEGEDPPPKAKDPFESDMVPGLCDGDYPPWLQPEMDYLLPADVLQRFGRRESTMLNGSYWHIPPENIAGITAALENMGWEVVHAPDLAFH